MRLRTWFTGLVFLLFVGTDESAGRFSLSGEAAAACPVTAPNGIAAGPEAPGPSGYGNEQLSVGPFGLWPEGTVVFRPGGPGFLTRDGSLCMKFGWQRAVRGALVISGRRLDASAPALRALISGDDGNPGFVATHLIFSTPGCWEVTGRAAEASLTFVTKIVKVGEGPAGRLDVP